MLIDASKPIGRGDEWVAAQVRAAKALGEDLRAVQDRPGDAMQRDQRPARGGREALGDWDAMVGAARPRRASNVDAFVEEVAVPAARGPGVVPGRHGDRPAAWRSWWPSSSARRSCATFHDEVPHAIGVRRGRDGVRRKKDLYRIFAIIYVERDSQKGIIIGKRGRSHQAASAPRPATTWSSCWAAKVFLDLSVKVTQELAPRRQPDPPLRLRGRGLGNCPDPR